MIFSMQQKLHLFYKFRTLVDAQSFPHSHNGPMCRAAVCLLRWSLDNTAPTQPRVAPTGGPKRVPAPAGPDAAAKPHTHTHTDTRTQGSTFLQGIPQQSGSVMTPLTRSRGRPVGLGGQRAPWKQRWLKEKLGRALYVLCHPVLPPRRASL